MKCLPITLDVIATALSQAQFIFIISKLMDLFWWILCSGICSDNSPLRNQPDVITVCKHWCWCRVFAAPLASKSGGKALWSAKTLSNCFLCLIPVIPAGSGGGGTWWVSREKQKTNVRKWNGCSGRHSIFQVILNTVQIEQMETMCRLRCPPTALKYQSR